jgi:hypothetical protein
MTDLERLSPDQQEIYEQLRAGFSPEAIANRTHRPIGIVNAQITRMRTKGIALPTHAGTGAREETSDRPTAHRPEDLVRKEPPLMGGLSSNEDIAAQLQGKALSPEELRKLASQVGDGEANDVHAMVLLGCTLQFLKLCGGRMHAHQAIEDAYAALQALVQGSAVPVPGKPGQTTVPGSDPLELIQQQLLELQRQNDELRQKVEREPAHSGYGGSGSQGW